MHQRATGLSALLFLGLAACQPGGEQTTLFPSEGNATCVQEEMQEWVGTDIGLFDPMPGLEVRIVEPDGAITMDYRPNRVTFEVNEAGTILSADCG